jgi:hypothetical protein
MNGGKTLFLADRKTSSYTTPRFHANHVEPAYKRDTASLFQMTNSRVFELVCGSYVFSFSCSAEPFDVSDIHIEGELLQTPIDKLFGRFMERIPQLSFAFRQHVLFRPIHFPTSLRLEEGRLPRKNVK